jgi:hypothetical protein
MKLHNPFIIGPRLLPALRVGDAFLSLAAWTRADRAHPSFSEARRDVCTFYLDIPGEPGYDDAVRSGIAGFHSAVEAFDAMLAFLVAAAESRNGSDNANLFPEYVMRWCRDSRDDIEVAGLELCDEQGKPLTGLIEH